MKRSFHLGETNEEVSEKRAGSVSDLSGANSKFNEL
jgi:hypothetical protein